MSGEETIGQLTVSSQSCITQKIDDPILQQSGVSLYVKRLDLIHPQVNGNKWFKLKYNLRKCMESGHKTLLTFGGAYSNHIHAAAHAGKLTGIKTIGIIRGEEPPVLSHTLEEARACGMQLEFITRLAYAEKETEDFKGWLTDEFGSFHLVPEGGSNFLGINGCMEILSNEDKVNYDYVAGACGTGATIAGLLLSSSPKQKILGFPVFKHGDFMQQEIQKHLTYFLGNSDVAEEYLQMLEIHSDYHFGGYAKWNDELLQFMQCAESAHKLPLDPVYTGKLFFGLIDTIRKGKIPPNSRVLMIHSGGLQGRQAKK